MTKQLMLPMVALAIAGGLGILGMSTALAYRGDPAVKGPNYTTERHEAMERAFETKNYQAWKELMQGRGRVSSVINEGNFARFAEAHELAEQGKFSEANAIRSTLGLPNAGAAGQTGAFRGQGRHFQQ